MKGDIKAQKGIIAALEKATIDSPRGKFTLSPQHNPTQDFYIREAKGNYNVVTGVAVKALAEVLPSADETVRAAIQLVVTKATQTL
mgnify:CR=1 FL=1